MRRKTLKKGIKQYTAYVPRTTKATKVILNKTVNRVRSFLSNIKADIKRTGKYIDSKTAKRIRSMRKKFGGK